MRQRFNPAEKVWIVERTEGGIANDVCGYIFLAEVADTAIVTPRVVGCDGLEETMAYYVEETWQNFELGLACFPMGDCYIFRCEAEEALAQETEG
jgi:hypothetical protein